MEELTRAEGTPEDTRMEVLLHDPDLFIAVYTPQRGLILNMKVILWISASNSTYIASPLEAKSWVLLDTSL